jgi:ParB/RepB/Spo0J family partition protein
VSAKRRGLGRGLDALLGDPALRTPAAPVPVENDGDAGSEPSAPAAGVLDRAAAGDAPPPADASPPGAEPSSAEAATPSAADELTVVQLAVDRHPARAHTSRAPTCTRRSPWRTSPPSIRARRASCSPSWRRPLPRESRSRSSAYEIIAGERRWRAAQQAGLARVPVLVRDVPDETALAMALIENIQRENLNPLEEARALARLVEEFGLTHGEAAEAVSRSRAAVSNLLRLLELEDRRQAPAGASAQLEMGHARALLALHARREQAPSGRPRRAQAAPVRAPDRAARAPGPEDPRPDPMVPRRRTPAQARDRDIERLEADLGERLGAERAASAMRPAGQRHRESVSVTTTSTNSRAFWAT